MEKYLYKAFFILLLIFALPFKGLCQIPFPKWVDDFGGSGYSRATDMVVDKQNNIYVTGYFSGTIDFDPSSGVKNLTSVGDIDIFIGKYTQAGTLIWAESMGGDGLDQPNNLAVDKDGNVSIAGQFESSNLDADPGPGVFTLSSQGNDDIFVIHLDTNGNFLWANSIVGSGSERGEEVSVDSQDNVITSSVFSSTITVGTSTYTPSGGGFYGLIVKYSSKGAVLWSISIGNNGDSGAFGDRVDGNDNIIISGVYSNQVNFNPLGTAVNLTSPNVDAPYVAKYLPSGILVWAKSVTGSLVYQQSVVGIDPQNNIYLTGAFNSPITFNGTTTINPKGNQDILLSKFSSTGNFLYAKSVGAANASGYNYEVACDQSSNVYLQGYFNGTINFNPNTGTAANVTYHGQQDFYLAKYDANGNYLYAFGIGSPNCSSTFGKGLAIDNSNYVDVAGEFCSTANFDPTGCSTHDLTAVSATSDGFIAQYGPVSALVIANNIITPPNVTVFCGTGTPAVIIGSKPTGGDSTYTYQWQSSPDSVNFTSISGATAINYNPGVLTETTYFLRTVSSGSCATPLNSDIIGIKIEAPLSNNLITAPQVQSFCAGGTPATITGSTPTGGSGNYIYQWQSSTDSVNFSNISGAVAINYQPSSINITTYFRRVVTSGVCNTPLLSNIITISITSPPATPVVKGVSVCAGTAATLSISSPLAGITYNWYATATGGSPLFTGTDFTSPALTAGTTYYAEAVNSTDCVSATRTTVPITVNPIPLVSAQNTSVCPGSTAVLTASSTDNSAVINWYASSTGGNILFTGNSYTIDALNATTTYYAEAMDNTTGCVSASRAVATAQIIQQLAAPAVTVSSSTSSSITFEWTAVTGATGYQVSTDNGQTFITPSSGSDGLTNTISGLQSGQSATIIVRATGDLQCSTSSNSEAVTGTATDDSNNIIYVPNAFTPNGDGHNDEVHVHGENIKSLKFYVYDQWGELLYTSTSVQNGWDGSYKGKKEPDGVYVYYLEAVMNDGQQINKKGNITLLR